MSTGDAVDGAGLRYGFLFRGGVVDLFRGGVMDLFVVSDCVQLDVRRRK